MRNLFVFYFYCVMLSNVIDLIFFFWENFVVGFSFVNVIVFVEFFNFVNMEVVSLLFLLFRSIV